MNWTDISGGYLKHTEKTLILKIFEIEIGKLEKFIIY